MKKIIVYGLGQVGRKIADAIIKNHELLDVKVEALVDRNATNIHIGNDIFVKEPSCIPKMNYDLIVVTSEKWFEDIKKDLQFEYNVSVQKIILYKDIFPHDLGGFYCNICENRSPFMLPIGVDNVFFRRHNIIGGGPRENGGCIFCGSSDRTRWIQHVLEKLSLIYGESSNVLHFAPEKALSDRIRMKAGCERYDTADIVPGRADMVQDITNLTLKDNSYDYIICNHVMEHIEEDGKAFTELKRILKPTGKIIFTVPLTWEDTTIEDDSINTDSGRLEKFGQEDHVRLYGKDLQSRLETFGFKVNMYRTTDFLDEDDIVRRRITIGCNSKLNSRLTPIRLCGCTCDRKILPA